MGAARRIDLRDADGILTIRHIEQDHAGGGIGDDGDVVEREDIDGGSRSVRRGDDAGGHGQSIRGIAALHHFCAVVDSVAVGIRIVHFCPDYDFTLVAQAIEVPVEGVGVPDVDGRELGGGSGRASVEFNPTIMERVLLEQQQGIGVVRSQQKLVHRVARGTGLPALDDGARLVVENREPMGYELKNH